MGQVEAVYDLSGGVYDLLGGLYSNSGRVNNILERVMMQSNDVQARSWKSIEILK